MGCENSSNKRAERKSTVREVPESIVRDVPKSTVMDVRKTTEIVSDEIPKRAFSTSSREMLLTS